MTETMRNSWQDIHSEILRRIRTRTWGPGELIPNETDLAVEFGCARATINRALQAAADSGLLERKRRAGTRVTRQPAQKAVLRIPVVRKEIEDRAMAYGYELISRRRRKPPAEVRGSMKMEREAVGLQLRSLHFADNRPFAYEDRWINLESVPAAEEFDFQSENANEWLLANAAFTAGEVQFSAINANAEEAARLHVAPSAALFLVQRLTWNEKQSVTLVRLIYAPGYQVLLQH